MIPMRHDPAGVHPPRRTPGHPPHRTPRRMPHRMPRRAVLALALALALLPLTVPPLAAQAGEELARQVEIRRTTHGVPHILAENIRAAGFGLGYVQVEDYGERVIRGLINAHGARGLTFGPDSMGPDFLNRLAHARAVETYHLLSQDTRDMLEGFAEGVNHYIRKNPDRVPEWAAPIFTGHDVAARDISVGATGAARDRKSTRLNSSHVRISYAVFCLKK